MTDSPAGVLCLVAADIGVLGEWRPAETTLPWKGPGAFMVVSGVVVLAIWLMDPVGEQLEVGPP